MSVKGFIDRELRFFWGLGGRVGQDATVKCRYVHNCWVFGDEFNTYSPPADFGKLSPGRSRARRARRGRGRIWYVSN
jgi:hypothetical protein